MIKVFMHPSIDNTRSEIILFKNKIENSACHLITEDRDDADVVISDIKATVSVF